MVIFILVDFLEHAVQVYYVDILAAVHHQLHEDSLIFSGRWNLKDSLTLIELFASLAVALQHGLVVPSLLVALFKYTFLLAALAVKNFMAFQDRLGHAAFDVGAQLFAAVGPFDFKQLFLELR